VSHRRPVVLIIVELADEPGQPAADAHEGHYGHEELYKPVPEHVSAQVLAREPTALLLNLRWGLLQIASKFSDFDFQILVFVQSSFFRAGVLVCWCGGVPVWNFLMVCDADVFTTSNPVTILMLLKQHYENMQKNKTRRHKQTYTESN
jgi:hypothetical protein